jgi:type IV pilus assembly protein PilW
MNKKYFGITLIELLIAVGILTLVIFGVYNLFINQHKAGVIHQQVADMQQNARIAMEMLIKDLRLAGLGVEASNAIVAGDGGDTNPDSITIRGGESFIMTTTPSPVNQSSSTFDVNSVAGFSVGDVCIIYGGGEWTRFTITQVLEASLKLQHNPSSDYNSPGGFGFTYPTGSVVRRYQEVTYQIDTSNPSHPKLTRTESGNTQTVSENIEDLQFVYTLANGTVTSSPANPANIRLVNVTLRARTNREDPKWTDDTYGDGYRRRVLSSYVRVRNLTD